MPDVRPHEPEAHYVSRCVASPDLAGKPVKERLGQCYGMYRTHLRRVRRRGQKLWPDDPLACLELRAGEYALPGISYKLETGAYGLDVAIPHTLKDAVNESEMSVTFPFAASHGRDRVGDFLHVSGIRTQAHRANPISYFDHGKRIYFPIGKTESPAGEYTVSIDPDQGLAVAKTYFSQSLLEAEQVFELCREGILGRAGSIGYRAVRAVKLAADPEEGIPPGLDLQEVELLEPSIVGLGANGDAVRKVLSASHVCGKSLSPVLRRTLEPLAAPKPAWSNGADLHPERSARNDTPQVRTDPTGEVSLMAKKDLGSAAPAMSAVDQATGGALREGEERKDGELDQPEAGDRVPHGAQLLGDLYEVIEAAKSVISAELEVIDDPELKEFISGELTQAVTALCGQISAKFSERYPDFEPLGDEETTEEPGTEENAATEANEGGEEQPAGEEKAGETQEEEEHEEEEEPEKSFRPKHKTLRRKAKSAPKADKGRPATPEKRLSRTHFQRVKDAADHLNEAAEQDGLSRTMKAAHLYHAKALDEMCKDDMADDAAGGYGMAMPKSGQAQTKDAVNPAVLQAFESLQKNYLSVMQQFQQATGAA